MKAGLVGDDVLVRRVSREQERGRHRAGRHCRREDCRENLRALRGNEAGRQSEEDHPTA